MMLGHEISRSLCVREEAEFLKWAEAEAVEGVLVALVGQEGEGHAENVDVFRLEQSGFLRDVIGGAA